MNVKDALERRYRVNEIRCAKRRLERYEHARICGFDWGISLDAEIKFEQNLILKLKNNEPIDTLEMCEHFKMIDARFERSNAQYEKRMSQTCRICGTRENLLPKGTIPPECPPIKYYREQSRICQSCSKKPVSMSGREGTRKIL
jgi:hypothetical protein